MRIAVTNLKGDRISFGRANGRFWGKTISVITIFIGFIMAGKTKKKQALHDKMARCLVVKKP
ncbi:MAG: RDD family protein [Hormoscilla sp. SP5CHS1]|nr:RDD family protein [Hormoscilla sp. SP12CHS1]MBC6453052.1 RDD family protein [Hormoscilla sp. SP5CHS1]